MEKRYIYRHENKYLISKKQFLYLKTLLKAFLKFDSNIGGESYLIRSLYLDTIDDLLYQQGIDGYDIRKKFRFRMYNNNHSLIKFEVKKSKKALKNKEIQFVKKSELDKYILGKNNNVSFIDDIIINKLSPKIIIDYDRLAFINEYGNIRITFDSKIRYSDKTKDYFRSDLQMIPVLSDDMLIMEVKYDYELPNYIRSILNNEKLTRISFSKYVLCMESLKNNYTMER